MLQAAAFAMGCFWGPQDFFSKLYGVKNTVVGYGGGKKTNPKYDDIGDNAETILIEYDSNVVSYRELLRYFFEKHDSTLKDRPDRYRSSIFVFDDDQQKQAEETKSFYEKKWGKKILTDIEPANTFWPAEEEHQHYMEKQRQNAAVKILNS